MTESEMQQKMVTMRYTSNIDQVFKLSRQETGTNLARLEEQMKK